MARKPLDYCHVLSPSLNILFLSCTFHSTIFVAKMLAIYHIAGFEASAFFLILETSSYIK